MCTKSKHININNCSLYRPLFLADLINIIPIKTATGVIFMLGLEFFYILLYFKLELNSLRTNTALVKTS